MKRIIIVCEGQTEQAFCEKVLSPYLGRDKFNIQCPNLKGIKSWSVLRKYLIQYLNESDVVVTTLLDYYGLDKKHGFPRWDKIQGIQDKNERIAQIENAMKADIPNELQNRFVPYIQLHEFEGLLFNDINVFQNKFTPEELIGKAELISTLIEYPNPEMINSSTETSPSHRLKKIIKGYNKILHGESLATAIGIDSIRAKSPRFNEWVGKLESM